MPQEEYHLTMPGCSQSVSEIRMLQAKKAPQLLVRSVGVVRLIDDEPCQMREAAADGTTPLRLRLLRHRKSEVSLDHLTAITYHRTKQPRHERHQDRIETAERHMPQETEERADGAIA